MFHSHQQAEPERTHMQSTNQNDSLRIGLLNRIFWNKIGKRRRKKNCKQTKRNFKKILFCYIGFVCDGVYGVHIIITQFIFIFSHIRQISKAKAFYRWIVQHKTSIKGVSMYEFLNFTTSSTHNGQYVFILYGFSLPFRTTLNCWWSRKLFFYFCVNAHTSWIIIVTRLLYDYMC